MKSADQARTTITSPRGWGVGKACARAGEGGDRVDEGDHQDHESFSVALCVRITINSPDWLQHAL